MRLRCFFVIAVGLVAVAAAAGCLAGEDDLEQSWPSPDGRFVLRHTLSYDHQRILRPRMVESYEQDAAYTLSRNGRVIWGVDSPVDESAHSFRCVWAADSGSALILDRPARGTVEMTLVLTAKPETSALHLQRLMSRVQVRAGDTDDRQLQKAWFGQWRYSKGRFEGIVICTRSRYYRLHVTVDPAARQPGIRLLDTKAFEEWRDDIEEL